MTIIIILLIVAGCFLEAWGSNIMKKAKGIYSPLDETIIGVLEGEKLEKAFKTQKRKKTLRLMGIIVVAIGGCVILSALSAIAMRLPGTKEIFGWLSVAMIATGSLLMYFGGDKPSGGDFIRIDLPSLKQIAGVILWFVGVALLVGLSIGN